MNQARVDQVVAAVLYEGYMLYPYRPSVKNRQRWTLGGLHPRAYSLAQGGVEPCDMQTQCLVLGEADTRLAIEVRFLHLQERVVGELSHPLANLPVGCEPEFRVVEKLCVGSQAFQAWQEATEREIVLEELTLGMLRTQPRRSRFTSSAHRELEPVRAPEGAIVGVLVRQQHAIEGAIEVHAEPAGAGVFRITVRILNDTPFGAGGREEAMLRSLVSAHVVLGVQGGEFVSLTDPPDSLREAATGCRQKGAWPVLVGDEGQKDTMLAAPIILYDYPQVAPESPGDLFDCTEIDEILTLRILTLTEDEKQAMRSVDERTRALLERTEALARDQLLGLHGAVRSLRPVQGEGVHGQLEP
jgi:hydrogenase maturation protease